LNAEKARGRALEGSALAFTSYTAGIYQTASGEEAGLLSY